MEKCKSCNGTGKWDEDPCPDCMGSGYEIPDKFILDTEEPIKKPKLILVGEDGNAFAILGRASRIAKKNGMDWDSISKEAMSGDYDHLLQTMIKYFDVE
jgi:hypothetical protein